MAGYNRFYYPYGIRLFSIVAKSWKLYKMQITPYFLPFLYVYCLFLAQT